MEVDVLGIDLAKRVFQLHGVDRSGRVLHRSKVGRGNLLGTIADLGPRLVVMELVARLSTGLDDSCP